MTKCFSLCQATWNRLRSLKTADHRHPPGTRQFLSGVEDGTGKSAIRAEKRVPFEKSSTILPRPLYHLRRADRPAAANWDDWEKFMALNETYVYLQALKRDGAIKEIQTDGVLYYTAP